MKSCGNILIKSLNHLNQYQRISNEIPPTSPNREFKQTEKQNFLTKIVSHQKYLQLYEIDLLP